MDKDDRTEELEKLAVEILRALPEFRKESSEFSKTAVTLRGEFSSFRKHFSALRDEVATLRTEMGRCTATWPRSDRSPPCCVLEWGPSEDVSALRKEDATLRGEVNALRKEFAGGRKEQRSEHEKTRAVLRQSMARIVGLEGRVGAMGKRLQVVEGLYSNPEKESRNGNPGSRIHGR